MDVIQYARFDGIAHTHHGFAAAQHEWVTEFGSDPMEYRVSQDVLRDLLRVLKYDAVAAPSVSIMPDGEFRICGVMVKLLPESYGDGAILAIHKSETLAMDRSKA